jgi:hypothetical protein
MKKHLSVLALLFMIVSFSYAADAERELGITFQMTNLLMSIDSFGDGYQSGVGIKWWPMKNLALRGLFHFEYNNSEGMAWTEIGLSAGAEYHPVRSEVSPYFGGFLGTKAELNSSNTVAFYFGGMAGVEMTIWKNVGAFAEYELLASVDENGFSVGTYAGGGAKLGLVIYF